MTRETAQRLDDGPAPNAPGPRFVQLPTDLPRTSLADFTAASLRLDARDAGGDEGRAGLDALEKLRAASPDLATLVGALAVVLHRYTHQAMFGVDVVTVEQQAHRAVPFTAHIAGMDALHAVRERTRAALAQEAGDEGTANIALTWIDDGAPDHVAKRDQRLAAGGFDVHLVAGRGDTPWRVQWNARLFHATSVVRLLESLALAVAAFDHDDKRTVAELHILRDADEVLSLDGGTRHMPALAIPVHRLFQERARAAPNAPAVFHRDGQLTYAQLDARASQLARHLRAQGVDRDVRVAVCLPPSLDVLVAMLAVWKAGGTHLPLDPTHPPALVMTMLEDAKPRLLLTHTAVRAVTESAACPKLFLDTEWSIVEQQPATSVDGPADLEVPCYLLYTSGTTGKPKGVLAVHANLAHYIRVAREKYRFTSSDVFISMARYTFSISMFEVITPLTVGGAVRLLDPDDVLNPSRLSRMLATVTVVHAGPSLLSNLFRYLRSPNADVPPTFPNMRHASSGGDLVAPVVQEEMKTVFPNAELFVIYGCTEVSVMGCTYPIERDVKVARSFVGKPFVDVGVRLIDEHGNLVPKGVVGEICFTGKGVVQGYLDRPELNAEKFFERGKGNERRRFYATGDLGRIHDDGNLEMLGRKDFQIQLRGIRIELAGIENTIRELKLAATCAVVAKTLDDGDVRLVAFVVDPRETNPSAFRKALAASLPDYMLPHYVVTLDALPLTANRKLDRRALDQLPWEAQAPSSSSDAPRNPLERQIAGAFAQALRRDAVGIDDNFFDLGGHSLLAVLVIETLEAEGLSIDPSTLFETPTVRALAESVSGDKKQLQRPILLNRNPSGVPVFFVVGVSLYRTIARHMEDKYAAFAFFEPNDRVGSIEQMGRTYLELIKRAQPQGPYRIVGMSFGGLVAYEVARLMRAQGDEVVFLGLVDAVLNDVGVRGKLRKVRRLASLGPRHVAKVFAVRAQYRLREKLGDRFERLSALLGDDSKRLFLVHQDDFRVGAAERERQEAYQRASKGFVATTQLRVPSTVIVAGERMTDDPVQDPTCGWPGIVEPITMHTFPTGHHGLLVDPWAKKVADALEQGLAATSSTVKAT